jgi:ABC-type lipoprotein release transport system permease subunit
VERFQCRPPWTRRRREFVSTRARTRFEHIHGTSRKHPTATALGAQPRDVLAFLGQGMRLIALGILLGMVASFWLTRWLSSLLFEITPLDPATFSAVSVLLLAVALAACWIPARRAARIDPMQALREQ